jgi:PHP family Zn ribbon phosphoesterase
MKVAVDLHIHTALSPCADKDMTPNNIVNMACLKGLDAIAITDHNSCMNVRAVMSCGEEKDLLVIPGMEVETREEVHVICLFETPEDAEWLQEILNFYRLKIPLNEEIFGNQWILNRYDEITASFSELLSVSVDLDLDTVCKLVKEKNGVFIPAHVDRPANGLISVLGAIPKTPDIRVIELSKSCDQEDFLKRNPYCRKYKRYTASDAHYLWDILERECFMEVDKRSVPAILEYLR